jgi:glycosyltransferase domain-containing protein
MPRKVNNPAAHVSLIIPTVHDRAYLFTQTLDYLSGRSYAGPIIVSDHSPSDCRHVIEGVIRKYCALNTTLLHHNPEEHFLTRLSDCASTANTPYVHLHADDDFLMIPILEQLFEMLEKTPSCSAAMGINIHLKFETTSVNLLHKSGICYESPFERLIAQLENYSSVLYALRRREEFIESVNFSRDRCPDVQFWQYLESCMAALHGTIGFIPELHYVRRLHDRKWSAQLVESESPDHFPYLLMSSSFHDRLASFVSALEETCKNRGFIVDKKALDRGVIHLLARGISAMGLPPIQMQEPQFIDDAQLAQKLRNMNDPFSRELRYVHDLVHQFLSKGNLN